MRNVLKMMVFFVCANSFAYTIKHEKVYSAAMKSELPVIVVSPDKVANKEFNTVYVLHGYSGNAERTLEKDLPNVTALADQMQTVFVLVDGKFNSWYVDSPIKKDSQYQTFVGKELVSYIDTHYPTKKKKKNRGIIGWSMGGYGALNIGVTYNDTFGAVGSVCGALDFDGFDEAYKSYQAEEYMGPLVQLPNQFKTFMKVDKMKTANQLYLIDCGNEDSFLDLNRRFHQKLIDDKVQHLYMESLGQHDTAYWSVAMNQQLALMARSFEK